MAAAFSMLFSKIAAIIQWFSKLFLGVFESLWSLLTDIPCWILEQVLGIAVSALGAFDMSGISASIGSFSQLPAEMINILGLLGFAEAMGIIAAAITIRIGLQLIPFTRLGS